MSTEVQTHAPDAEHKKTKQHNPLHDAPRVNLVPKLIQVPTSDIPIKSARGMRSSSSRFLGSGPKEKLERLPALKTTPKEQREELFLKKIGQCKVLFDFTKTLHEVDQKEIKRETLLELVEYVLTEKNALTAASYKDITEMLSVNLFRPLPPRVNPSGVEYDPEEDEPILEAAWPHIQIVYEFFLRFLENPEFDSSIAKNYFTKNFVQSMLDLFDSEDPRERDYLKTTLHRIYGKFLSLRSFVRKAMKNIFVTFIYETEKHNGIAELLEILGSIINGFTLPLKDEHKDFLFKGLIPLHKPKSLALFHPQLSYCVAQFIEKDPPLVESIFRGILRYWPQTNSAKEILFVNEIEELLSVVEPEEFNVTKELLFTRVARCISSLHFQVAEKALTFWTNEYILGLVAENVDTILPLLFGPLYFNSKHHWNKSIRTLAYNALKLFMDMDYRLFNDTIKKYKEARHKAKTDKVSREQTWQVIAELAIKNSTNGAVDTPEQRAKAVDAVMEEIEQFDPNDPMFKDISAEIESNRKQARKARRKSLLPYDREVVDAISNHVSLEDMEKRNEDDSDSVDSDEEGSHEDDDSSSGEDDSASGSASGSDDD